MLRHFLLSFIVWALTSEYVLANNSDPTVTGSVSDTNSILERIDNLDHADQPENLFKHFRKLQDKASQSHDQLPLAINFFNERIAGFLRTKESWLQALTMIMMYSDIFLDEIPAGKPHWELKSFATTSLLRDQGSHHSPGLANGYRLAKEEYGKGGKESLGMKAQLWVPIDPLSTEANIIVFRGTCFTPTIKAVEKNLGTGMAMNMDLSGFGRTAFEEFWPVFNGWIDETRDIRRKLIITGHSLGGVMARRLHIQTHKTFPEWTVDNVESTIFNSPGLEEDAFAKLKEIPHAYHIANAGDLIVMIRWNPKSHLLVHHDPTPRNSYLPSLSFEEARRWHNHPGLLFTELQKGAAASPKGKITPYPAPVSRNTKGGLGTSVMSQFYAIGVRRAIWTLRRRVVRKRSSDPCLSREAWRVELGPDGMAKRVVVAPWFQQSLAPVEALIRIGLIFNLQKQVLKNALGSLARLHPLLLLPI